MTCPSRPRFRVPGALLLALLALLLPATARAQSAPAGNAHPDARMVSEGGDRAPFGQPVRDTCTGAEKAAFAAAVNTAPLRALAVHHNGRVKILDTLARETLRELFGRPAYIDLVPAEAGAGAMRKVAYDPVFTLIDMVIDPVFYVQRPIVHIEYLPLREAFIEHLTSDPARREAMKRLGRLSPAEIVPHLATVTEAHAFDAPMRRAIDGVRRDLELFGGTPSNLLLVPADTPDEPWRPLAALEPGAADPLALRLGTAWRARDAAGVNAALAELAARLPAVHPEWYPGPRRELELAYNRSGALELGAWLYALAFVALVLAFGTGRAWLSRTGLVLLALAIGVHGVAFVARCILAERFAIQNQFESMTGLSLFAALAGLAAMAARRQQLFAAAAAVVGCGVLLTATQAGIPGVQIDREAAILNTSVLLKYHVTTVLLSYGLIALGFVVSLFYLGAHYATGARGSVRVAAAGGAGSVEVSAAALGLDDAPVGGTARVLHELDRAQMSILQLAFWTLGVGILLGAWWADHSWGRWWGFDPKEVWALITWIVYLVVIHVRFAIGPRRGLVTAWLSVVGFVVMLWTYFGVNLLLPGLHAYA